MAVLSSLAFGSLVVWDGCSGMSDCNVLRFESFCFIVCQKPRGRKSTVTAQMIVISKTSFGILNEAIHFQMSGATMAANPTPTAITLDMNR
jgi:hypothetical protein